MNNKKIEYIAKREGKRLGLKVDKLIFDPDYKMEARIIGERGLFFFGDWSGADEDEVKAVVLSCLGRYAASRRIMIKANLLLGALLVVASFTLRQYATTFVSYTSLILLIFSAYMVAGSNIEGFFADIYARREMDKTLYYQSLDSLKKKMAEDSKKVYGGGPAVFNRTISLAGPWLARQL